MAKTKISEFSATPGNNTDIDGINIAEGCAPSGINDAIRELMAQLKDWQAGTSNDPYVVGSSGSLTLSYGTANGVPYLNGSKVLTSGSALTFDGAILGVNGVSVGRGAGAVSTNTAVGASALAANTTGANNTAFGYQSANASTTVDNITAIGYQALLNNTAAYNTAVGRSALASNTSGGENVAVGGATAFANTTGTGGTAVGYTALRFNTTGASNTAIGNAALFNNTTASNNTAVGYQAGYSGTTAADSTYLGYLAGYGVTTGTRNTLVGFYTGSAITTGTFNSFFGTQAGQAVTTGGKNTILGCYSGNQGGLDIRTASNYIVLSDGDGNPRQIIDSSGNLLVGTTSSGASSNGFSLVASSDSVLRIGHASGTGTGSQYIQFNYNSSQIGSITQNGTTGVSYNTSSDYRLKEDIQPMTGALAKVAALKPCTYKWKVDGSDGEGFIAHELAEVCPQAVTGEKDAVDAEGNPVYQGIDTSFLVATLTAAIQELKAEFDAYKATHP